MGDEGVVGPDTDEDHHKGEMNVITETMDPGSEGE